MGNEDFLKAAADRAQVGSSAEVAQKARDHILSIHGTVKRDAVFVEILSDGTLVVGMEVLNMDRHQVLFNLAHSILDLCKRAKAKDRAEIVDGNP